MSRLVDTYVMGQHNGNYEYGPGDEAYYAILGSVNGASMTMAQGVPSRERDGFALWNVLLTTGALCCLHLI